MKPKQFSGSIFLQACGLARKPWKSTATLLMASLAVSVASACTFFDNFTNNNDGTVTDPRSGLIWKRCAEGASFTNGNCVNTDSSALVNWFEAMQLSSQSRFLDKSDWRLPTKDEMLSVVVSFSACNKGWQKTHGASSSISHNVKDGWPGKFWASTPAPERYADSDAFQVDFRDGNFPNINRNYRNSSGVLLAGGNVRLVRGGQQAGIGALEFDREYAMRVAPLIAQSQANNREVQDRQSAYQAKQTKDEATFNSLLKSSQPRAMYLGAVNFEDGGDKGKAKAIYRELIKRHAPSQEALLASRRLTRLNDVEAVESSNSNASSRSEATAQGLRSQNFNQCMAELQACSNRCYAISESFARRRCEGTCQTCSQ